MIEINEMFLEKDVTRLSGVWKEYCGNKGWFDAGVEIKKLA